MTGRMSKTTLLFIMTIGLITVDACRKKFYATAEDMAEYGWVLFETKEYLPSNVWFSDAVSEDSDWKDGYNGLGWTYAKLMVLDSSISHFTTGLTKKQHQWNPIDVHSEILAGLTFANNALGKDAKAIQYGGLDPNEALKLVTINPAKQLQIDKYVGSLEPKKDADFVIWDGMPLGLWC